MLFIIFALIKTYPLKPVDRLTALYKRWSGKMPEKVSKLEASGSKRQYFRLSSDGRNAIGAYNSDLEENRAFISFTKHFLRHDLPVPEIYMEDQPNGIYLIEDLGDRTLFQELMDNQDKTSFSDHLYNLYLRAIERLVSFQLKAGADLDYSLCYPRSAFDRQSIIWDLNYFKYNFLKLAGLEFNEQMLEDDFHVLTDFLLEENTQYFMYRDFQARNILLREGDLYFIDYQGGRKGPLAYDLASLLFQVRADLPFETREELLEKYLEIASDLTELDPIRFKRYYYGFVLLRLLQVLGAYGLRGLFERKEHFLRSIPYAAKNIKWLMGNEMLKLNLPALNGILQRIQDKFLVETRSEKADKKDLIITLYSFSYKKGIPANSSGHGGGFVFDCRALPNPGRSEEFMLLTGKDQPVIDYLQKQSSVHQFIDDIRHILSPAIDNYLERGFASLMVSFGCTGGQHRSVYCAERTRNWLEQNFPVRVNCIHRELA